MVHVAATAIIDHAGNHDRDLLGSYSARKSMNEGMTPVEFVGGPLDGEGQIHPLQNALCLEVQGSPEGYYSVNPYQPDGKYYWIIKDRHYSS